MPKAVIFDVDGTLIDSVDLHAAAWVETFRHFGLVVSHGAVRSQIGKGGDQLMPVFVPRGLLERRGGEIETFRADLFKRDYLAQARAFPGVRALFERIRAAGQTVVLASSGKADEVERYQEIAGITDLVQAVTTSDDAERSKPHPDIFEAAPRGGAPVGAGEPVVGAGPPHEAGGGAKAGGRTGGVVWGAFPEKAGGAAGRAPDSRAPEGLLRHY